MAQEMQQFVRQCFLQRVLNPDFRQALIGWQFARCAAEVFALNTGANALRLEPVHPQRGDRQIGGLDQAWHGNLAKGSLQCAHKPVAYSR